MAENLNPSLTRVITICDPGKAGESNAQRTGNNVVSVDRKARGKACLRYEIGMQIRWDYKVWCDAIRGSRIRAPTVRLTERT
jgi:hypothetical protein